MKQRASFPFQAHGMKTEREVDTYDHLEEVLEHDQPKQVVDIEHVAFLLKPLLEPLVEESAKLRHQLHLLLEDMYKSRVFDDSPVSISANVAYELDYKERRLLFLFTPQTVTLTLSSGGTIVATGNVWTSISFARGTKITAASIPDASPLVVIVRASDIFFFSLTGVPPWLLNEAVTTVGTNVVLTANTVYLIPVEVNGDCVSTGIRFRTVTATGTSDVGIYDSNGNLLAHSGAVANSGALQILNFLAPLPLPKGKYILAITPSNSTDTYQVNAGNIAGLTDAYTANTGATAGVLPNATGGMVTSTIRLQIVGLVIGGAP